MASGCTQTQELDVDNSPPSPTTLFRILDEDGSGKLDVHELKKALAEKNCDYDLSTVQALMRLFSSSLVTSSLELEQFLVMNAWIEETIARFNHFATPGSDYLVKEQAHAAFCATLEAECARANVNPSHFRLDDPAFSAFFNCSDPDNTSTIDGNEFLSACVTLRGLLIVFKAYRGDETGRVSMNFSQLLFALAHVL